MDDKRTLFFNPFHEIRAIDSAEDRILEGLVIPYDKRSVLMFGSMYEYIKPGTFDKHLATKPDVYALINHDPEKVLGRTKNGTLSLEARSEGIHFTIKTPKTGVASDLYESVKRGDVTGMSFGFKAVKDTWSMEEGKDCRSIHEAVLKEVSVVTYPAYRATEIHARSIEAAVDEYRKLMTSRYKDQLDIFKKKLDLIEL